MSARVETLGIVWFRQDLRLADNPALLDAHRQCDKVIALFIDDPMDQTVGQLGAASKVWLYHALCTFNQSLEQAGGKLLVLRGDPLTLLTELIASSGATRVCWNRCYDPLTRRRDEKIKKTLSSKTVKVGGNTEAVSVKSFNGLLLCEPWDLTKDDGNPYRVFTPFWRKLVQRLPGPAPLPKPRALNLFVPKQQPAGLEAIDALDLLPAIHWDQAMMQHWRVGEKYAKKRLNHFIENQVGNYGENRNIPGVEGTSRMSPHLHFGEISSRQIIHALHRKRRDVLEKDSDAEKYAREIGWREFASHLIYHFPAMVSKPLDKRFEKFPWARKNPVSVQAWQAGQTGVPIVDAGMRELWQTGWMHNRVRMIVASYLIKNLLVRWQEGESWFRDTLVDADLASNAMGWQWVAGSGADAAPFFRVFNPVLQGEKFDTQGEYVRYWVPELRDVPTKYIHKPWELASELRPADYPAPLVDLQQSRLRALMAFDRIKASLS
ncbi:MAG: DNA photolyase family protein [Granulosicoccus sp.]|nr:DNA photolyase family protein [Granulosicoccus sp.]